jgi:four helix bundle protein
MSGQSYRDLLVWQKSMQFVTEVYRASETFPKTELYGLTSQLRRSAISVPSNIAEGQGRDSQKEFIRHLSIAYGSLMEAETQIQIATNLRYLEPAEADRLVKNAAEIGRMMNGLTRTLRKSLADN